MQFEELSTVGRRMRSPEHRFAIRQKPYIIQPFLIAPVLPGESLKNALLQSRVVTDPIKNPLIGWWIEYYVFYVKHRDLADREHFTAMMLDPEYDLSSLYSAANIATYHFGGTIDWARLCLDRVVEEYFRNEGEEAGDYTLDGLPIASINQNSWLDSAMNAADFTPLNDDVDIEVGVDDKITAGEVDAALRAWQWARMNNLTQQTYEDFLRSYGVKKRPLEETHKPELLRYVRDWSYPTNTIEPTTGAPSSAVSWAIAERLDKARFFSEPGFIFGVTVARPKVYLSKQTGSGVGMLADAVSWLPAVLRDDPFTSLRKIAASAGPLPANADVDGYWVDVRDLFLYGDQFINFSLSETDAGLVALPTTGMEKRYVSSGDVDALFKGTGKLVRQDGVMALKILGHQQDATAQH